MVKSTIIARVVDGLPLAASMDDEEVNILKLINQSVDLTEYKTQAKQLFKRLAYETEQRCTIESAPYVFHYLIEFGVCYLTLCEKSYPKKLAFAYLEELQKEFQEKYGHEIGTVARPYAFVKFGISSLIYKSDSFIQKTKRQYKDARAQRNLQKLNEDLNDVTRIMTKNIQDVLGRGETLDRMFWDSVLPLGMQTMSSNLSSQSKKYLKDTKKLHWQALYQKYGPPVIVVSVVLIVFYIRVFWW